MRIKTILFVLGTSLLPPSILADGPTFAQYSLTRTAPAPGASGTDEFGIAIAMQGDTLLVGAHFNDDPAGNSGSAYVFRRNQGGANNWGHAKKLSPTVPGNGDEFGFAVDVDGDVAIVGEPFGDDQGTDSGAAYIFARNQGGADQWGFVAKLTNTTGAAGDQFGFDVAIDGDTAVVGTPLDDDGFSQAGAAHIFFRNQGGADKWGQVKTIQASDRFANDQFGRAVDIDGDILVVGAPLEDVPGDSGSIYIFSRNQGGAGNWGQLQKRKASDASSFDEFGHAVALDGDRLLVGAPFSGTDVGSAYLFEQARGGANNWGEVKKLVAADGANNDEFGFSVAINGTVAMVGAHLDGGTADSGSAYLFDRNAGGVGNWGQSFRMVGNNGSNDDETGYSVALIGDTAAAGAPFEDLVANNAGAVYLYTLTFNQPPVVNNQTFSIAENSPNTTLVGTVAASDPDAGQTRTFAITADPSAGAFSLHPTTGALTVLNSSKLDFETNPQYVLTVQVTDNGTPALSDTASITVNITDVAENLDLKVTKTGPATAVAGTGINYTLVVSNAGPTTATGVVLRDQLPAGVTPTGLQTFNIGTLAAGAATTINIPVTVNANTTGSLVNNASVTNAVPDLNPANNTGSASTTVSAQANLAAHLTIPSNVVAGTELDLTVEVSNAGPSDALSVAATFTLPPGVLPTGTVMTNLGTIAAGGSRMVVLTVDVEPGTLGDLTNLVSVSSAATDPAPGNNSDSEVVHVTGEADLSVDKSAPATTVNGATLHYTISVTNLGPSVAVGAISQDVLPPFGVTPNGTVVTPLGDLLPGQVTNFTINVTVTGFGGTLVNQVGVGSTTPDPVGGNNIDSTSTQILSPADLSVSKTAAPSLSDTSNLVYTLVVGNIGASLATNVTLVDTLPAGVAFHPGASDPGCTESNGVVTCLLGVIPGGGSVTAMVAVVVSTNTVGSITNLATASTTSQEINPGNNTDTAVTAVTDFDNDLDPDFHDPDDDNDHMPDAWEWQFGLNPTNAADAAANSDSDPHTNLEEYISDTNPTNELSYLRIDQFDAPVPTIGFASSSNRLYTLEYLVRLPDQDWAPVPGLTNFPGIGGTDSRVDGVITPEIHYRLKVKLP